MHNETLTEELHRIVRQMEGKCVDRQYPEDKVAWEALIGNPILDEIPMGISYYDADFVLLGYNRTYGGYVRTYAPYTPKQAVGMCFFDYKPGSARASEKWLRHVRDNGEGVTRYDLPLWMRRDDRDSVSYWNAHFTPVKDDLGRIRGLMIFSVDVTEHRLASEALQKSGDPVASYSQYVEELKRTLRVLLDLRDKDGKMLEENISSNVRQMLLPYVDRLKRTRLDTEQLAYLEVIESGLRSIVAPTSRVLSSDQYSLTPMELQIVGFVREGKISKEIAELLGVSKACIDFHRNNIRKKLNLNNKKASLRTHLVSSGGHIGASGDSVVFGEEIKV
jgi:DNA-binding CsgD family transcriptional regulator